MSLNKKVQFLKVTLENTGTKSRADQITGKGTKVVLGTSSSNTNQKGKIKKFLRERAKKLVALNRLSNQVAKISINGDQYRQHPFILERRNSNVFNN